MDVFLPGNQRQLYQTSFSSWYCCLTNAIIQNRSSGFLKSFSSVTASWPVGGRLWHMVTDKPFSAVLVAMVCPAMLVFAAAASSCLYNCSVLRRLCVCVCMCTLVRGIKEKGGRALQSQEFIPCLGEIWTSVRCEVQIEPDANDPIYPFGTQKF